jgi:hypothetical protein
METRTFLQWIVLSTAFVSTGRAEDMRAAYERAAQHLPAGAAKLMRNVTVEPVWLPGEDKFTYRRQLANDEKEFVLVDATPAGLPRRSTIPDWRPGLARQTGRATTRASCRSTGSRS